MNQYRHAVERRAIHHRNGHIAALGEHDVGLQRVDQVRRLSHARRHAERIAQVFHIAIAAQLSGFHGMVGNALHFADQLALDAGFRPDVMNVPALPLKRRDQRQGRRDMTRRTSAR